MKILDVEQGSVPWYEARLGIATASSFDKIITPKTRKLSAQAKGYAFFLIAEKLLNRSLDTLEGQEWMERGKELEPDAVKMYEFEQQVKTKPVGFITTDDGQLGASPDRLLVGVNGGLELKCPAPQTHVKYLLDGFGDDYFVQVQGQMYVGELDFVDRYSYHPEMPPHRERIVRDESFIADLASALRAFNDMKAEMYERIKAQGFFAEREKLLTPVEAELGEYGNVIMAG